MAIKTKNSRDTYRSNVKERPLRQNGLEAQYQGLDISEVNIDHAGLQIIGRGGYQTRREIRKVRKQYIVDVPQEEHSPTAELVFLQGYATDVPLSPFFIEGQTDPNDPATAVGWGIGAHSLQSLNGESFQLEDSQGNAYNFVFTNDQTHTNGELIPATSDIAVNIYENNYSKRDLMFAITGSIEAVFPTDTFRFELYPLGSTQRQYGIDEPVKITEDKIVLFLSSSVPASAALTATSDFLDDSNNFDDQAQSHEWRLNGFHKDLSNSRIFFEDLRTDTIQSAAVHSNRPPQMLLRNAQFPGGYSNNPSHDPRSNYDQNINDIAGDPISKNRFATHDSQEVLIRQYPKREELFDTYQDNFQWREDIHFISPDQQVWSLMEDMALTYHSTLEEHIIAMMDTNFADEQYIDTNPLSGRIDALNRLSRIFDMPVKLPFERHQYSQFDQYLEPINVMQNVNNNRFPVRDVLNSDAPFEDVRGKRTELGPDFDNGGEYWVKGDGLNDYWAGQNSIMFIDYHDQEPLECHDYIEDQNWTRIDETMLGVLTSNANRSVPIDRREWQESGYVYTSTGLINSQTSSQDGIIYREMKR